LASLSNRLARWRMPRRKASEGPRCPDRRPTAAVQDSRGESACDKRNTPNHAHPIAGANRALLPPCAIYQHLPLWLSRQFPMRLCFGERTLPWAVDTGATGGAKFISKCNDNRGNQMRDRGILGGYARKVFGAISLVAAMCAAPVAHAQEWGCEVLLCLANPQGPTALAQCVSPITRLWNALANFQPFPTCDMAGSAAIAKGPYATSSVNYYSACPSGTTALAAGVSVVQGTSVVNAGKAVSTGIGTGDGLVPGDTLSTLTLPPKVCVGGSALGTVTVQQKPGDIFNNISASVYPQVVNLRPLQEGNVINVYVDNALYTQVRY